MPKILASACTPFSKSPTFNQTKKSTRASIYSEQSVDFRISIKLPSYFFIGVRGNIIYNLFIAERSYKYKRRNITNIVQSLDISVISCTVLIVKQSTHRTKLLFFLHQIYLYVNPRTIVQPKYDIINYTKNLRLEINILSP